MLISILACSLGFHAITFERGLATSVGSVFGKPGPRTRPSCYVYCLHRARKRAESGRGRPCSLAYWLVRLVFKP